MALQDVQAGKLWNAVLVVLAVCTLIWLMLAVQGAHRLVHSSLAIPLVLVATIAEQVRRKRTPSPRASWFLFGVQVSGFVLAASMLIAAGILRR